MRRSNSWPWRISLRNMTPKSVNPVNPARRILGKNSRFIFTRRKICWKNVLEMEFQAFRNVKWCLSYGRLNITENIFWANVSIRFGKKKKIGPPGARNSHLGSKWTEWAGETLLIEALFQWAWIASRMGWNLIGIGKGDKVIIYMPMVPWSPGYRNASLCRIGAIHSVVFAMDFQVMHWRDRITDCGCQGGSLNVGRNYRGNKNRLV